LTNGIINKEDRKETTKLMIKLFIHISIRFETNPTFIKVKTIEMNSDINNDINAPNNIFEYFLSIFIL
jgi:hypothetical protein